MIVIVMPYYDRQFQLNKTLMSLTQSEYKNFSVVIVDDCSPVDIVLPELPYEVHIIKMSNKTWSNCAPVYNTGFQYALNKNPDVIIIQSPECYHVGDVLSHAAKTKDDMYVSFGCFQIDEDTTFKEHDILELIEANNHAVDSEPGGKGQNAWWNHSVYNPSAEYWCAAITPRSLTWINGIDERFAYGYACEDTFFVHQVIRAGLNISIPDYPFVVHQWHPRVGVAYPLEINELYNKNFELYKYLTDYKSRHLITPDLTWSGS